MSTEQPRQPVDFAELFVDGHEILPALLDDLRAATHETYLYHPRYLAYLENGIDVYEYNCHFTDLKMAVFDERWSLHGSTNLNYRSLEDDKDFELVVVDDDEAFAKDVLERVRDLDVLRGISRRPIWEVRWQRFGSRRAILTRCS